MRALRGLVLVQRLDGVDVAEHGRSADGETTSLDRRLYMQLHAFGDARETVRLAVALEAAGVVGTLYDDVNDPTGRFRRADDAERGAFLDALARHGIGFVRRYSGGADIHAACGMLASSARGGEALSPGT